MGRPQTGGLGVASQGFALHIGLDKVDAKAYGDWDGTSQSAIADAEAMSRLSASLGYKQKLITNTDATSAEILTHLSTIAADCTANDILLLTFSGHGGQVADLLDEKPGGLADTWVLYDRMLVDHELRAAFSGFPPDARIVVVSDCCHSGTDSYRLRPPTVGADTQTPASADDQADAPESAQPQEPTAGHARGRATAQQQADRAADAPKQPRFIPPRARAQNIKLFGATYQGVQLASRYAASGVAAGVLLLAACQDNQIAWEDASHGAFTHALLDAWNDGHFAGDYTSLIKSTTKSLRRTQEPNLFVYGGADLDAFQAQRPFTIATPEREASYDGFAVTIIFNGQSAHPISITVASGY